MTTLGGDMCWRASGVALTMVISLLLSIDLGAGAGAQVEPDSGPGGRRWTPMPFFPPGADMIVLVGDPLRGGAYLYVKFPVAYAPPLHSHKATERIYVNRGTLLLKHPDGGTIREPEGQYFVVKARSIHTTVCAGPEDCFCYVSINRALDVIPFRRDNEF